MAYKFLTAALVLCLLAGCTQAAAEAVSESEALPAGYSEVYGKVKEASGNEITLVLGTLGGQSQQSPAGGDPPAARAPSVSTPTDGADASREAPAFGAAGGAVPGARPEGSSVRMRGADQAPAGGGSIQPGGPDQAGGPSQAGNSPGQMGGIMGGGQQQGVALDYTGEEATYQIPVTAKVTTGQGESARTVSFTQIGYKNILKLTLNENGTIVSVVILQ